jgi:hypothetical protein
MILLTNVTKKRGSLVPAPFERKLSFFISSVGSSFLLVHSAQNRQQVKQQEWLGMAKKSKTERHS